MRLNAQTPAAGLAKDCPFREGADGGAGEQLTTESVEDVSNEDFADYASRLYQYLQVGFASSVDRVATN